jgi:transcriptional regulator with XRE-family HTH domain
MNTKLNNAGKIKKAFADKFDQEESREHLAQMLAFRFLGVIEKITDERHILRKDLAKSIDVSPSYITQLYRGVKPLNFETLAKIEAVLEIRFEVRAVTKEALELNDNKEGVKIRKSKTDIFLPSIKVVRSRAI